MNINEFPYEILSNILEQAAKLNERDGVTYTFGLSQAPQPLPYISTLQRYVRGPVPPDMLSWDVTAAIRNVCWKWHEWALGYAMKDVYIRRWKGSERWAELSLKRESYNIYELIEKPSGVAVYRDPYRSLRSTAELLAKYPNAAAKIRRLWFNGFFIAETDSHIFSAVRNCPNLTSLSIPWTMLRHLDARSWSQLLGNGRTKALKTLELLAVDVTEQQAKGPNNTLDLQPLRSNAVDFSRLKRLKIFGNTTFMPINDDDLFAIAKTATRLEEFHLTCLSTITIDGVMAIVKASQSSLRVLEHSPRSNDGFWHPHPGMPSSNEHLCEVLAACPKLETVSLSIPSMCATLFANPAVNWSGDFQVRATTLCGHENPRHSNDPNATQTLAELLEQSRQLVRTHKHAYIPKDLYIELFFADCIFEPGYSAVHGDFQLAQFSSEGIWPSNSQPSRKGPYGSTGLYGKDDEGLFERVDEQDFLDGIRKRFVSIVG